MTPIRRLNCHSSLKHYELFHCNRSSGYDNSVFNVTYNINSGCSMWGGGNFWSGLWGGLGMGLGAGIMNLFGGGLGNMYGSPASFFGMNTGYPMMNMWGGGLSNISNWFGFGGKDKANKAKSKETEKAKENTETPKTETGKCGGDSEYLHTLRERLNKIKSANDPEAAAKDLYNDIDAVIKKQKDDEHNKADEINYKDLKNELLKEWEFECDKDGVATKATLKSSKTPEVAVVDPNAQANVQDPNAARAAVPTKEAKEEEPKLKDYISKVDGTEEYATKQVLSPAALEAIKAKKYVVRFAKHERKGMEDTYLKGTISRINLNKDNETVKSYTIDCTNGKYKLQYEVTPNSNGTAKIKCISTKGNYYKFSGGINYIYNNEGMLENQQNDALVINEKKYKELSQADKQKYEKLSTK